MSVTFTHVQVGRQEPVMVLRVDKEKGYIDLSKRRVSPEDVAACDERFSKSKMVHSIMRHVAETTGQDVEELYKWIAWPLYKAYGHAFDAFKVLLLSCRQCSLECGRTDLCQRFEVGVCVCISVFLVL